MSLKNKYKTNTKSANAGVWFDFPNSPNGDGTVPGFKLARKSSQNTRYSAAVRDFTKHHTSDQGVVDLSSVGNEEAEKVELDVFVNSLLVDWRNFQPDDDGKVVQHSKSEAAKIFENTDWVDLYKDLVAKCSAASGYKERQLAAEAKN